jgi:Fic family protein
MEEAITSSQIEGATTTREVAKQMILQGRKPRDRSEQMILNNYRTMQRIIAVKEQKLTKELILELHRMVTEDALDNPTAAGRFRRPDEHITVESMDGETLYVPPPSSELDRRCEILCDFANSSPKPYMHPVVRSMIIHFMMGYDHPFVDGNGRMARALFYWSMLKHGYWLFEFISISQSIIQSAKQYGYAYLRTETDNADLTCFLIYHTKIIRRSIAALYRYIDERSKNIQSLLAELRGMDSLNHRQRDLISHALRHPDHRYTYESHRASHGVVHQTARTDILVLVRRGLLRRQRKGRAWQFVPVPDLEARLRKTKG